MGFNSGFKGLIKHHTMKAFGILEVWLHAFLTFLFC